MHRDRFDRVYGNRGRFNDDKWGLRARNNVGR